MVEVVPVDVVYLSVGDMVPADIRVVSCKELFIGQSSLIGESELVVLLVLWYKQAIIPILETLHLKVLIMKKKQAFKKMFQKYLSEEI